MDNRNYKALTVEKAVIKIVEKFFAEDEAGEYNARRTAKLALQKYLVETGDGSYTFISDSSHGKSEYMHTSHGAVSEALEKFVKPAKLEGKKSISVLDICSGLGYNAASCIEYLDFDVEIDLHLIEISKETLALSLLFDAPLRSHKIIKKAVEDELYREGSIYSKQCTEKIPERIHINLHLDDARTVVKKLLGHKKFDAIFLDPFSPLQSPELYTDEFFRVLKNLLKDDGIILTYTSAAPVRSSMVNCGLQVGEGPLFGRRRGTVATLKPDLIDKSLSRNDERMIALSDAGVPFRDPDFSGSSRSIMQNRSRERESSRLVEKFPSTVKTPVHLNMELPDGRLKRRVLNNLKKTGFNDLKSFKSRYVVCPQYSSCICGKGCENYNNSRERINEMKKRLKFVLKINN